MKLKKRKANDKLKVFFLTTGNAGTAFYRQWQFKEALNRLDLASAIMPWYNYKQQLAQEWQWHVQTDPRIFARTGVLNTFVKEADVIVVQYLHTWEALALVEALKACHPEKVFLTEIDDNVLETPPYNVAFDAYQPGLKYRDIVVEQLKALDGIIVSTPYLKQLYKEFNKHIYVVPNCINFDLWDRPAVERSALRVGWAGALNHSEDLKTIADPVKQLIKETKGAELHVLSAAAPEMFQGASKVTCHTHWAYINKYPRALAELGFNIGLAPLLDNGFNRAKSNLRKLEYGALGIPVLAAKVGHFAETVKHGRDGFLYSTTEEFVKYLKLLMTDEVLRKLMGRANRADVKLNFNVNSVTQDYFEILFEVKKRGQTTKVDVSSPEERRGLDKWIVQQPALS